MNFERVEKKLQEKGFQVKVFATGAEAVKYPDPLGGLHTPEMVEASASEYAMENALNFVKGLSLTAAELMAHSEHLLQIQLQFAK